MWACVYIIHCLTLCHPLLVRLSASSSVRPWPFTALSWPLSLATHSRCACVRVSVRVCVRVSVRACVRVCLCLCESTHTPSPPPFCLLQTELRPARKPLPVQWQHPHRRPRCRYACIPMTRDKRKDRERETERQRGGRREGGRESFVCLCLSACLRVCASVSVSVSVWFLEPCHPC